MKLVESIQVLLGFGWVPIYIFSFTMPRRQNKCWKAELHCPNRVYMKQFRMYLEAMDFFRVTVIFATPIFIIFFLTFFEHIDLLMMMKKKENKILLKHFPLHLFLCLMDLNPFYFSVVWRWRWYSWIHWFLFFIICRRSLETASKTHESIAKRLDCFQSFIHF